MLDLGFDAPNHRDNVYLEISRNALAKRGLLMLICVPAFFWLLFVPSLLRDTWKYGEALMFFIGPLCIGAVTWCVASGVRLDVSPPRDEPLRFNRARQRIYAYNFRYRWWNPFERWQVVPVAYDWSQVRAEKYPLMCCAASGGR
ncbi:hypothetical protein P353_05330 [Comamonas testosteroni]|uniref:DUF6708 domain-containing protein n=2 Tax=Comamonadaceae TaxID=80864 RepID=A0A096FND3_COMTE|nr:hypothetical protein P353_05330 [Comamonas testosteroni]